MTPYQQMYEFAAEAARKANESKNHCIQYAAKLLARFREYSGIPATEFHYFQWNDTHAPISMEDLAETFFPNAIVQDEADGFWRVGVGFRITSPSGLPKAWVTFMLCVGEKDGNLVARLGSNGPLRSVIMDDNKSQSDFFQEILEQTFSLFNKPTKAGKGKMGFSAYITSDPASTLVKPDAGPEHKSFDAAVIELDNKDQEQGR